MTQAPLLQAAPAKINLFLHVVGRRQDGYHLLDSLAVFADAQDSVTAEPADTLSLSVSGPFAAVLEGESDNLVLRAARGLAQAAGIVPRARLTLSKALPVASGIGGGSADAAAALRACARLWDLAMPEAALAALAQGLGADVPVCVASRPARMGGIGEVLNPAPALPPCGLVLVNPGVAVSTPSVFRARDPGFSEPARLPEGWADVTVMARDLAALRNDLADPAIRLCPVIAEVLDAISRMPGCQLARMSGSGATCWGLFDDPASAEGAAAALARGQAQRVPAWWCWGGRLFQPRA